MGIAVVVAALAGGCDGGGGGGGGGNIVPLTLTRYTVMARSGVIDTRNDGYSILADFDGDGDRDDAATGFVSSGAVILSVQTSLGKFTNSTIADGYGDVRSLATEDFDGTAQVDIVYATDGGNLVLLLAPAFSGGNSPTWDDSTFTNPTGVTAWYDVRAGEVDGQDNPDVIAVSDVDATLVYFRATGTITDAGNFQTYIIADTSPGAFQRIDLGDIDGDGDQDCGAVGPGPGTGLAWFENPGGTATGTWTQRAITTRTGMTRLIVIDIDDDGDLDIVTADPTTATIFWYENLGSPRQGQWDEHTLVTITGRQPDAIAAADLDGDGTTDLLIGTDGIAGQIHWATPFSNPRQTWQSALLADTTGEVGQFATGDIDGLGKIDFITSLAGSDTPIVFYQQR